MTDGLFIATVLTYALALALYLAYLVGAGPRVARVAYGSLLVAFLLHLGHIGANCLRGLHPLNHARDVLSLSAWLLTGGFLIASLRAPIAAVGCFVAPVALMLLLGAGIAPSAVAWSPGTSRALGSVHISLATLGTAAFALAAACSALYLITESKIKRREFGALFHRAPPLDTLDSLVHRSVRVGFPIFTVGLVLGVIWAAQRSGSPLRPEYVASVTAWCAFAALLVARMTAGWRGRRAAILALVGFATSALVLVLYVARGPLQ